jgi:hypothetical protein
MDNKYMTLQGNSLLLYIHEIKEKVFVRMG